MSERSAALLIDDILEAAAKIASYTAGMAREDFNCVSCPRNSPHVDVPNFLISMLSESRK